MICRICGEDINEKGQDNVSPISGYPVCEDCKNDIMCYEVTEYYPKEKPTTVANPDTPTDKGEENAKL